MLRTSIISMLVVLFTCPCYAIKLGKLRIPTVTSMRAIELSQIELAAKRRTVRLRNVDVSRLHHFDQFRTLSFPSVAEVKIKWENVDPTIPPLYERSVKSFMEAKRELNMFFEYQRLEPEFIEPFIKSEKEGLLNEAQRHLYNISSVLSPEDPSVKLAQISLQEAFEALHPTYTIKRTATVSAPVSRQLVDHEFLLWKPGASQSELMQMIRAKNSIKEEALEKAAELPEGRTVAFVNDDPEMLDWARQWAAQGYFGPGSRLAVFDSLDSFMQKLDNNISYDLVLIDWVLEDGFALPAVQKIRSGAKFPSVILLNSALWENEVKIQEMFDYGFDGFISSIGFRHDTGGARIALSLWNYEQYKKMHQWER